MTETNRILVGIKLIWASPWSLLGTLIGALGLVTGGGWQRRNRVLEFYGGWIDPLLRQVPIGGGAHAMTLGHTVIGCTERDLDRARSHELVHVAQYECWGPLFVPVYLISSLYLMLRGADPYLDNPFEREAYDVTDIADQHDH